TDVSKQKKMTNHEKTRIDEIVSYTPPQLYTGKEWYIGFMAFDPALGKLHRKRIKINHVHGGVCAKRKYAQDLLKRLNEQLSQGWNPWIEAEYGKSYNKFEEVCEHYKRYITKLYKDDVFREETFVAYSSFLRNLRQYNEQRDIPITYIYQLNSAYVVAFLDHIYIDREYSPNS
ncbi:MAG: site-specific integrase, partial [Butyricimonas faecihominis]